MTILSSPTTIALVHYPVSDFRRVADALTAIQPTADRWLTQDWGPRFHVVTASQYALIVGFVAVDAADGHFRIVDHAVSPLAENRDDVLTALVEAAIDAAESPWGDVIIEQTSELMPMLIRTGWRVSSAPCPQAGTLSLTGAGVQ